MLADISKLRSELAMTQRDTGDAQKLLELRVKKLEDATFRQQADRSAEKEKLELQVEQLKTQLDELQASKPAPTEAVSSAEPVLSRTDQVASIKTQYEGKEFERVVSNCDAFLKSYPDDRQFSAQVLYWRGDSYYELGEYKKAILSFQELLTKAPKFSQTPEVLFKVGDSLEKLKFPKDAKVFFQEVIEKHAKSSFAAQAKKRLKK
jgi:TolA-binding protein